MQIPEVHTDHIEIAGHGKKKLEWLSRIVMGKDENNHNLVIHIYHVNDDNFQKMMERAWVKSGIMAQGVTCELSYTDGIGDFEIDAYDAIFFKVDPTHAKAYKDMFVGALQALYQEQMDAGNDQSNGPRVRESLDAGGDSVPKMQQNSNSQNGPQEE